MKVYKIIFSGLLLMALTGCETVTNIKINKDLSIKEETIISQPQSFWDNYYMTSPRSIVSEILNQDYNKNFLNDNRYKYLISDDSKSVTLTKEFSSILDYVNNSKLYNNLFEKLSYSEDENIITVKTVGFKSYVEYAENIEVDSELNEKAKISITVPYVVTDNNADSFDRFNNTYTWNTDKDTTKKSIILSFDKSRPFIKYMDIYISIAILIVIFIGVYIWYKRIKKVNKNNNRI